MKSLLDRYIPNTSAFRPGDAAELFALRLAQKLGDDSAVRHYVELAGRYSESQLLCAYRRALRANGNGDPARRFHAELERIHTNGHNESPGSLVSIRVERRAIALAIFDGGHLEHADARQLSSAQDKAVASAVGFVSWTLERFPVESAVFEEIPCANEVQRRVLHEAICKTVRDRMISIWEIPRNVLYGAWGRPPLKSRSEVRQIATAIWPVLAGTHARLFIQDAAILGLHVQTERLFIIN
jgi:hypothetical protein